jgi:hypothetical protein
VITGVLIHSVTWYYYSSSGYKDIPVFISEHNIEVHFSGAMSITTRNNRLYSHPRYKTIKMWSVLFYTDSMTIYFHLDSITVKLLHAEMLASAL